MPITGPINIQPKRILVITLRFLGDTLLTTPLISSLKRAYPNASVDVMTFKANAAILEGNPDINRIITLPGKPKTADFAKLLLSLFRHYDLSVSTQAGDRPALCAIITGKTSLGFVTDEPGKAWWKKWLLSHWLLFTQAYGHAVLENLRFCNVLNIQPVYKVTPPQSKTPLTSLPRTPYAVLHIMPQWRYKEWHTRGWREAIDFLSNKGLSIVVTGSGAPEEQHTLQKLEAELKTPVINLAGQLSIADLTELIGKARLFIGPDTGITHLAAATGTQTFALFGPTDPAKWAPWPLDYAANTSPFSSRGTQHVDNVFLIQDQTERHCLPCQKEGCNNIRNSHSDCLDNLSADQVINVIREALDSLL